MNQGAKTIISPVSDLAKAKEFYTALLGVAPYADAPYYVGYRVGDQEIGLGPRGHRGTGALPYYLVDDIKQTLDQLLNAGGQGLEDIEDVGGGKLIASVKDPDGNAIGLMQNP